MMNEFGKDMGLIHEAVVTGRKVGAGHGFWATLAHSEELFKKVVALVAAMLTPVFRLVAGFDRDMTKEEKWELLSDTEAKEGEFKPELVEFLKDGEDYVSGDEMVKRTDSEDCGGQRTAEAMLREQDKIPQEFRKYYLVFPKTVWRLRLGGRRVAYLHFRGGRWYLGFFWLGNDFGRHCRVVRLGKVSS